MSKSKLKQMIIACTVLAILAVTLLSARPWERTPLSDVHTLTTVASPSGAGLVSLSPPGGEYEPGVQVTLTANPTSGYVFEHWAGGASGSSNPVAVTMTSDKSITAHFGPEVREVRDWHDLHAIRDNLNGNYVLVNDLDSTTPGYAELASDSANGGKGWQPIGSSDDPFTGGFDGQGHEIRDLIIHRPDESHVGLFAHVSWRHRGENVGAVENVGVVSARVSGHAGVGTLVGYSAGIVSNSYSAGSVTATGWYAGGLVGYAEGGLVTGCYSSGSVTGTYYVGGLVGRMTTGRQPLRESTLTRCYSSSSVAGATRVGGLVGSTYGDVDVGNSCFKGSVTGRRWVGGLVAENYGGTINNCYSTGAVVGDGFAGGLVALNLWGTVNNCYSSGAVSADYPLGGLVGQTDEGTVNNSFWNINTSGLNTSDGGTGKTTAEMMSLATFTDTAREGLDEPWDIVAVAPGERDGSATWNIVDGNGYPLLSWQAIG